MNFLENYVKKCPGILLSMKKKVFARLSENSANIIIQKEMCISVTNELIHFFPILSDNSEIDLNHKNLYPPILIF